MLNPKSLVLAGIVIGLGLLLSNATYVNAAQMHVTLKVYNTEFDKTSLRSIATAYNFESSNVLNVFVTQHMFDRLQEIYGVTEFPFTYQQKEFTTSYKVWDVTLSANIPVGTKLVIKFVPIPA